MLFQPNLAKAVGSDYVARRIEELRPIAHVFGAQLPGCPSGELPDVEAGCVGRTPLLRSANTYRVRRSHLRSCMLGVRCVLPPPTASAVGCCVLMPRHCFLAVFSHCCLPKPLTHAPAYTACRLLPVMFATTWMMLECRVIHT